MRFGEGLDSKRGRPSGGRRRGKDGRKEGRKGGKMLAVPVRNDFIKVKQEKAAEVRVSLIRGATLLSGGQRGRRKEVKGDADGETEAGF